MNYTVEIKELHNSIAEQQHRIQVLSDRCTALEARSAALMSVARALIVRAATEGRGTWRQSLDDLAEAIAVDLESSSSPHRALARAEIDSALSELALLLDAAASGGFGVF